MKKWQVHDPFVSTSGVRLIDSLTGVCGIHFNAGLERQSWEIVLAAISQFWNEIVHNYIIKFKTIEISFLVKLHYNCKLTIKEHNEWTRENWILHTLLFTDYKINKNYCVNYVLWLCLEILRNKWYSEFYLLKKYVISFTVNQKVSYA